MHSFTPVFKGVVAALACRRALQSRSALRPASCSSCCAGRATSWSATTSPISSSDLTDYTIPVHGEKRGLPHVEIEIRQDLIAEEAGQRAWAERLIRLLPEALSPLQRSTRRHDDGGRQSHGSPHDPRRSGRDRAHDAPLHRRAEFLRGAERRRVQGPVAGRNSRRSTAIIFRRAGDARHPQHAAPAGRLPQGRHRGDVHADPQPHQGRARPQPRLQDHRLQRAAGLVGRRGDRRDQAAARTRSSSRRPPRTSSSRPTSTTCCAISARSTW